MHACNWNRCTFNRQAHLFDVATGGMRLLQTWVMVWYNCNNTCWPGANATCMDACKMKL